MAAEELEQKKEKCENLVRWRLLKKFSDFLILTLTNLTSWALEYWDKIRSLNPAGAKLG